MVTDDVIAYVYLNYKSRAVAASPTAPASAPVISYPTLASHHVLRLRRWPQCAASFHAGMRVVLHVQRAFSFPASLNLIPRSSPRSRPVQTTSLTMQQSST